MLRLATLPLISTVPPGKAVQDSVSLVMAPVDPELALTARPTPEGVRLAWPATGSAGSEVFYRILRARPEAVNEVDQHRPKAVDGVRCQDAVRGAPACELQMTLIGLSRSREWVDRAPSGRWSYRVAVAANYADDPLLGDMLLLSPAVRVAVP